MKFEDKRKIEIIYQRNYVHITYSIIDSSKRYGFDILFSYFIFW